MISHIANTGERTSNPTVTIILGAGASAACDPCRYPALRELLSRMLQDVGSLSSPGAAKQGLYLAYAIRTAHRLDGPSPEGLGTGVIQTEVERVKRLSPRLDEVFGTLEGPEGETRAYWALASAIGIYMYRMYETEPNLKSKAHRALLDLVDKMVSRGTVVNVIDFNWDCLVERMWWSYHGYGFGWNCGRNRHVIEGVGGENEPTMSELAKAGSFRKSPWDEEERTYARRARLIKPHGDMCTFLRGQADIFYCGGRHGQTTFGLFPRRLADMGSVDEDVRSSILPPTNSRWRHEHKFYDEEVDALKAVLTQSDVVAIIGWSARGADSFYEKIFRDAMGQRQRPPRVTVVDKTSDGKPNVDLESRARKLFGEKVNLCGWWQGFSCEAVEWLRDRIGSRMVM